MIRVDFSSEPNGNHTLRVSGHALWSAPGTDIVCAAVSVLVENLGNALELLVDARPAIAAEDGLYVLSVKAEGPRAEQVELLLAAALLGLRSLSETHPDRIFVGE